VERAGADLDRAQTDDYARRRAWARGAVVPDLAEAFSRLRAYARNHNRRLTDVAQAAVNGTLDPQAWAPPGRARPS